MYFRGKVLFPLICDLCQKEGICLWPDQIFGFLFAIFFIPLFISKYSFDNIVGPWDLSTLCFRVTGTVAVSNLRD